MNSSKLRLTALVIVLSLIAGCGTAHFERPLPACPVVVEYEQNLLNRAADELWLLPADSAIDQMLRDFAVMRAQARSCRRL